MDCKAIKNENLAERYLHNRLNEAEMETFETHLLECANCRREFELLQAAQADLAARAHEIRTWTPAKPFFLRWQAMSVAALVVVVLVAGAFFFRPKKTEQVLTAQQAPSEGSPRDSQTEGNPKQATINPEANPSKNGQDSDKRIEDLPINGRDYKNFTLKGKGANKKNVAPAVGPAPTSGVKLEGSRSRENTVIEPPAQSTSANNSAKPVETAENHPKPQPQGDSNEAPTLTVAQGAELYRMAEVVAPPYTFSGLASKGKLPDGRDNGQYSAGGTPSDTGRQLFKNAMAAYVEKRYGEAGDFLENAAQHEPKAADINFYWGVCELLLGHPQDALGPLKKAVAAGNSAYLQSAHYYLAKAYLQEERFDEAANELRNAAALSGRLTSEAKSLLARTQALQAQLQKK